MARALGKPCCRSSTRRRRGGATSRRTSCRRPRGARRDAGRGLARTGDDPSSLRARARERTGGGRVRALEPCGGRDGRAVAGDAQALGIKEGTRSEQQEAELREPGARLASKPAEAAAEPSIAASDRPTSPSRRRAAARANRTAARGSWCALAGGMEGTQDDRPRWGSDAPGRDDRGHQRRAPEARQAAGGVSRRAPADDPI